ncbi:hypothetical protein UCREL1_9749 [Eutypa lata UCREL1]|uniref:Ecp2 effector protein domain-containing protein n=1 Tax=Eutypa lata (strain UCR-EL1) TaxID=1287681 RepID=M7SGE6_EUTLA|nr:hypothetical protein UCREL1_9749 [Eutypa lata UCREL1]
MKTQTLIQLLAVAASATAAATPQYGSSITRSRSAALPRRIDGRAGTGPVGVLTVDDTDYNAPGGAKLASVSSADSEVFTSEHVEGAYTSCIPVFAGATVPDCEQVLGDIRANNGSISVEGGHCMNWWEGTCLARVCAREQGTTYTADAQWIADAIEENALDVCVAKGQTGVVADCEDNADPCGTYRFWLQSQPSS